MTEKTIPEISKEIAAEDIKPPEPKPLVKPEIVKENSAEDTKPQEPKSLVKHEGPVSVPK